MPRYIEVIAAASETATKILTLRASDTARRVVVTAAGGKTASVHWHDDDPLVVLNMPSLPADAMLTRAEADRLVAFIGHECCHVIHTSKAVWVEAVAAGKRVREWTNALEDVRIEAAEIAAGVFPALGGLLAGILNHLHYEAVTGRGGKGIARDARNAPYVACVLGRMANGYAVPAAAGLMASQSAAVKRLTDIALADLPACQSTADVLVLARAIVALENAGRRRPDKPGDKPGDKPQEGQEGSDEGQEGQEGSDEGQEGEEGSDEGQEGQEGEGQEGEGQEGEGQEGEEGSDEGQEGEEGSDEGQEGEGQEGEGQEGEGQEGEGGQGSIGHGRDTDANLTKTIERIAERAGLTLREVNQVPAGAGLSTVQVSVRTTDPGQHVADHNRRTATMLDQLLPRNALLSGQIGRLLVSAEVRRVTHRESSGRLDRRALTRLSVGAADVYSRRDDVDGIDTALMVLIDGSISMSANVGSYVTRMMLAQVAAWHIAKAAEAAGAKVALAAFHDNYGDRQVTVVKPWNAPAGDCAGALAAVRTEGGTPLAPSILAGAGLLAAVTATRRILMVLTDGECAFGADAVRAACRLAGDDRVEVVGIGMNCASVTAAFPPRYSVNVEDLTKLAAAGLGVLTTMLEEANPRGAD